MKSEEFERFNFGLLANKDGKQDKRQPCVPVHCNYLKMFINKLFFFFYNEKFELTIISR